MVIASPIPTMPRICPRCRKPIRARHPRRVTPHWRNPRPGRSRFDLLNMAAGDRLLDANGNVILDTNGNVMLSDGAGDECCCNPCEFCSSGTPEIFRTTISGWTSCGCSQANGFLWLQMIGDLNGTFDLERASPSWAPAGACVYLFVTSMKVRYYSAAGCSTVIAENDIAIGLYNFGSFLEFFAGDYSSTGGFNSTAPAFFALYAGSYPAPCDDGFVFVNENTACSTGFSRELGIGGTAEIVGI